MEVDQARLEQLLSDEVQAVADISLRARVRSLLIKPVPMLCAWDYGEPGEIYPCWKVVGEPNVQEVGVVYSEHGFGPALPWGLIWLREVVPSIGQDCGWFATFREAAADLLDVPPAKLNVGQGQSQTFA